MQQGVVHPHQRCRYSDSPFARKDTFPYCRVYFSILQGLEMSWRGWTTQAADTKRKLYPRKNNFFVMEKYVEDAKQKEKDVPDLVESIMRSTCLVKEELRPILSKLGQFRPEITKIRV